jgi:hypothetical protein
MAAPVVVALTNEYVTDVLSRLLDLPGVWSLDANEVRAALEAAPISTSQAEEPGLFGSTP